MHLATHSSITIDDLLGTYEVGEGRTMAFVPGLLVQAVTQGRILVLDGLEYAPRAVLELLQCVCVQLFDDTGVSTTGGTKYLRVPGAAAARLAAGSDMHQDDGGQLSYPCDDGFRLVCVVPNDGTLRSMRDALKGPTDLR